MYTRYIYIHVTDLIKLNFLENNIWLFNKSIMNFVLCCSYGDLEIKLSSLLKTLFTVGTSSWLLISFFYTSYFDFYLFFKETTNLVTFVCGDCDKS